jgi:hypothetical protein
MNSLRYLPLLGALLWCALAPPPSGRAAAAPQGRDEAAELARRIDALLERSWAKDRITPAKPAEDEEFVRRVYLDLAGRIPGVTEVREFLADSRPDKRRLLVDRLLARHGSTTHMVHVWRNLLLPELLANFQLRAQAQPFDEWLRGQLSRNVPYDRMVRELLTVPLVGNRPAPAQPIQGNPQLFYQVKEFKPENLASAVSRVFLGINVGCAQCHDHPFASWKREEFWSLAAFYSGLKSRRNGDFNVLQREVSDERELAIPGTDKVASPRFLDGTTPRWRFKANPRVVLAEWITRADNPYFARAVVNRLWAYFLGHGLIEPLEEMVGAENHVYQSEVLDELARAFVAQGFDLHFLMRAITSTRAYQLSSAYSHASQNRAGYFARMPLRGLTAEQLFDSIAEATGYREGSGGSGSPRGEFLTRFGTTSERPTEVQTSILQALSLMNGSLVRSATTLTSSETLAAVADAPFLEPAEQIEILYMAALSRKPRPREMDRLLKYLDGARGEAETRQALADIFWALLNSSEFYFNH